MFEVTGPKDLNKAVKDSHGLIPRIEQIRKILREKDPYSIATLSGTSYRETSTNHGEFCIPHFSSEHKLSWPEMTWIHIDDDPSLTLRLGLFLYYLSTSDGTPLTGRWVNFADLPGGRMYAPAFHGYTGAAISRKFGLDCHAFELACYRAGGQKSKEGDASYLFNVFPCFKILAVYWVGDDEFPSVCNLLFDGNAIHYLPIDACAMTGSLVTRRLMSTG